MADKQQFIAAVNSHVAELAAENNSPSEIVSRLATIDSVRPLIAEGKKAGLSEAEIVAKLGGVPYQKYAQAHQEVENSGVLTNAARGAKYAATDMGRGLRRTANWIVGDDEDVAMMDQRQAQAEADPLRMAAERTGAAQFGNVATKVAPNIAAAALTGGTSLPAQAAIQAGVGAVTGLADPHGNPVKNAAVNAGLSGLAVPGANAVGSLGSKVLSKTAQKAASRAANLEAKAAQVDELAANRQVFNKSVAEKVGLKDYDGPIDSTMVRTAETQAKEMFEAASTGRAVQVPKGFTNSVKQVAEQDLEEVGKAITRLINKPEFRSGTFVPSKKWIEMRSKVAALARDAKGSDAHYIGQIVEKMDDALGAGRAAEQVATLNQAREIWRNLQPVKDIVKKSGDTGEVTWQHFKTAVSRDTDKFARGQAPLQDLAALAEKLQPQGKLLNKLDELKPGGAAAKAAGSLLLDAVPFGNTLARATSVTNNPNVLRGIANISQKGANAMDNKVARQILGQLVARGVGSK